MTNAISNFVVHNQFWADNNEQAARYVQLALSSLDSSRQVYFSFEQPSVYESEGGTIGTRPSYRVQFNLSDLNVYKKSLQNEMGNPQILDLEKVLPRYGTTFTRMFYQAVPCEQPVEGSVKLLLTEDELEMVKVSETEKSPFDDIDFELVSSHKNFEVQNTFWAKDGFEAIARKVAQYICRLDSQRMLFFSFNQDPVIDGEGGTVGDIPTYTMLVHYANIQEYHDRIVAETKDPLLQEALQILEVCVKTFTRQFWLKQNANGNSAY